MLRRHLLLSLASLLAAGLSFNLPAAETPPNFVLCMADDQGYNDVGYYGNPLPKTPTLDEMAATGLRFDRFYAAAPVCSPTRGSVMTGRHPNRFACFSWGHTLRPQETTVAEALKSAGYATGHFGKWHLGSVRVESPVSPGASGFDRWLSAPNFYENDPLMSQNGKVVQAKGESSMVAVDAALDFIDEAITAKKPFLAVVWFGSPHTPHVAEESLKKLYPNETQRVQNYYAEISGIDRAMKKLREQLKALHVADNTLLWYTSDNGPQAGGQGSAGKLKGRKGSLWEGGIREPTIIEWPAKIPQPRSTDMLSCTVDIYPTLLDLAGVKVDTQPVLDGESLAPLLRGERQVRKNPLGFWVAPSKGRGMKSTDLLRAYAQELAGEKVANPYTKDENAAEIAGNYPHENPPGHAAIMEGVYKLHRIPKKNGDPNYQLFNIAADPAEKKDLLAEQPQVAARLKAALAKWQELVINSINGKDY